MAKPIINNVNAFDATKEHYITFVWQGSVAYNNKIFIYDADSLNIIYEHKYSYNYYKLQHLIPANTLVNGNRYAVSVQVFDIHDEPSQMSDKFYFQCLSTPSFSFLDINDKDEINMGTFIATLDYFQAQNDKLTSYVFYLYDGTRTLLYKSNEYTSEDYSFTYRGLSNNTTYFIRSTGVTNSGFSVDTGLIEIYIKYIDPSAYARIYAECDKHTGIVHYWTNAVVIESERDNYEYEDGKVILSDVDQFKQFTVTATSQVVPKINLRYFDLNNSQQNISNDGTVTITTGFNYVDDIVVTGKTTQLRIPRVTVSHVTLGSLTFMNQIDLIINGVSISNVNNNIPLYSLPAILSDSFILDGNGSRTIIKNVGIFIISYTMIPESMSQGYDTQGGRTFTAIYNVNARQGQLSHNIFCTSMPIQTDGTSCKLCNDGKIEITWHNIDSGVYDWATAQDWLDRYETVILYPLKYSQTIKLTTIAVPSFTNQNELTYKKGFTVPAANATYIFKFTDAFKTQRIVTVKVDDRISFTLSSVRYDLNARFKLTVMNSGSNYVMYSPEYEFDFSDEITVYIRRKDPTIEYESNTSTSYEEDLKGVLYGMWVYIKRTENEKFYNFWLGRHEPTVGISNEDVWIDTDEILRYIPKEDVIRIYQDEMPTGVSGDVYWIGGGDVT